MRDHQPTIIEEFNGLWARGSADSTPMDHFSDCNNIQFIQSGFRSRDGLEVLYALGNIIRIYRYTVEDVGESLLALNTSGNIYHTRFLTPPTPILTIPTMTDFGFVEYAGRGYITPSDGNKGLINEAVYVYKGDGTPARKAGGAPPTNHGVVGPFAVENNEFTGVIEEGIYYFGVINATAGDLKSTIGPEVFAVMQAPGGKQATAYNVPTSTDPLTAKRLIVATKPIDPKDWNPDPTAFQWFVLTTINDNVTDTITGSFTSAQLVTNVTSYLTTPDVGAPSAPTKNALYVANNSNNGGMDTGFHLFAVTYETDTGFLTSLGPELFAGQTIEDGTHGITISGIPTSPNDYVVKRRLVATKKIELYGGNERGYQFFFIPNATIDDNTTTTWSGDFFDADLLQDASYLLDIYSEIPAGVGLNTYHNRMLNWATNSFQSIVLVSNTGDPETFSQIDGLLELPLDSRPTTYAQEFRDILYVFKAARTYSFNDSGDVPTSWPMTVIDQGVGCSVHGIATVLDSGGVNIDYLLVTDQSGIILFNGSFLRPELTWKIRDYWAALDRSQYKVIQIMNDSVNQRVYINLPNWRMLYGDYSNGLDPKNIRWTPWSFDIKASTIALMNTDRLIIGSAGAS